MPPTDPHRREHDPSPGHIVRFVFAPDAGQRVYGWRFVDGSMTEVSAELDEDGLRELKGVLEEFLGHLGHASHVRLQRLLFYAEIWCLQTYGRRFTNAGVVACDNGSFSRDVELALEEMCDDGEVAVVRRGANGRAEEYQQRADSGDLPLARAAIVEHVCRDTADWSSEQLEAFVEQTWLYENTPTGERMDFETYREEVVIPRAERERIADRADAPVGDARPVGEYVRQ